MKQGCKSSRRTSNERRLRVEPLEDRRMLAVLTVQNNLDDTLANLAGDGQLSLREAIAIANNPGTTIDGFVSNDIADEIRFDFGHDGPESILLQNGELLITSDLTITGDGPELLTIDAGNGTDNTFKTLDGFRVLNIDDGDANHNIEVMVEGLTITGGDPAQTDLGGTGGGIRSRENVTLLNSVVTGNAAVTGGGIQHRYGTFQLMASTVSFNSAFGSGGGISNGAGADYTLGQRSTLIVSQSTIHQNSALPPIGDGGGISSLGELHVANSTISGNVAGDDGGGVQLRDSQDFFTENTIINSTISGNSTPREGGGIFSQAPLLYITHTTITENSAGDDGGGIAARFYNLMLHNTIVSGNWQDGSPGNLAKFFSSFTGNYNLLGSGDTIGGSGDIEGVDDPLLGPLANNGGPTKTHALLPGSPAIDAGDPSILFDANEFDQRGNPFTRVAIGILTGVPSMPRIDIGSYEAQGPPSADFNNDIRVDGRDFLSWQRSFAAVGPAASGGDSDYDGDADASDLAAWQVSYGSIIVLPPLSAALEVLEAKPTSMAAALNAALTLAMFDSPAEDGEYLIDELTPAELPRDAYFARSDYLPTAACNFSSASNDVQPRYLEQEESETGLTDLIFEAWDN
ncbi:choice-of-anchor Q domain-containing protein [Bythopirellula polymerisocia]|nr:choice-of-anchor Q domain-containing protein [Bythopirellula polymerisocia]